MDETLRRILALIGPKHGESKKLADYLGIHPNVITNWKSGRNRSYRGYLPQIAEYFGVSVAYLQGLEEKEHVSGNGEPADHDSMDDLKFALFGGEEEITDEMFEEVKAFAEFVKQKYKKK